jgi:hypothetical protein
LCQLEDESAELRARLDRQQIAIHEAVVTRDATIQELRRALTQQVAAERPKPDQHDLVLHQLVADLERRLTSETRRSVVLTERLASANAALSEERSARTHVERDNGDLRRELATVEALIRECRNDAAASVPVSPRLDGVTLLYVGGRTHHIAQLRAVTEGSGASFVHHDGGIEHHLNLLAGLTSQANLVVFPVDCISHHAAQLAKQLCRQTGKRFIPLRSASATSLLAALRRPEVAGMADAAD